MDDGQKNYEGYNKGRLNDGRRTKNYKGYNQGRVVDGQNYRGRQKPVRSAKKEASKKKVAMKNVGD